MKRLVFLLVSAFLLLEPSAARAEGDLCSIGAGLYDVNDDKEATDFRLEYRWDSPLVWLIKPWAGAEVTTDGAIYALGGLLADIKIGKGFLITPSIGAGLYEDGNGKDLGHTVEFRSQLELGWEFDNGTRFSVAAGHISNADLAERNPGSEFVSLYYHIPVGKIFRN